MQISNQRKINGTPINILNGQVIQKSQAAVNRCSLTQCQTAKKSCQRSNGPDSRHYLSHQCVTYTSHIPPTVHLLSPSFFLDGTRRRLRKRHPCNLPNNVISDISCLFFAERHVMAARWDDVQLENCTSRAFLSAFKRVPSISFARE